MRIAALRRTLTDSLALVELFVVTNIAFLAADIAVAHSINQFSHWAEWIPLTFSCIAPVLLVFSMLLAGGVRPPVPTRRQTLRARDRISRVLGLIAGCGAIFVGIAGLLWHLNSQFFQQQTIQNLVYTAPFVAPLAYTGLGLVIILNRMVPDESDEWARWIVLLAWGGWIGNFILSLADHAQNAFFNPAEWIAVVASALAVGALVVAVAEYCNRPYLRLCIALMVLEIIVGVAGWLFHLRAIAQSPMKTVWDRVVYSAPAFAPLLFADLALLAIIGLATLRGLVSAPVDTTIAASSNATT